MTFLNSLVTHGQISRGVAKADTRRFILDSTCSDFGASVSLIMAVVYCSSNIGTGGMEVSVVLFIPHIHVLAYMLLRSVAL